MAVKVRVPAPLRKFTNDQVEVEASGANIKELIEDLESFEIGDTYFLTYPGTASMKTVVIFQDNLNFLIGGMPTYEYTRISFYRLDIRSLFN